MTQLLPLSIVLGPANTGLVIGYTVLNLNRSFYNDVGFTTNGVVESAVPGTYYVAHGYQAPDEGGYLVISTPVGEMDPELVPLAEMAIEPAARLGPVQGDVEFGQVKMLANVDSEGALHLVNSHANGVGLMTTGGSSGFGQKNTGRIGTYDLGTVTGAKHEGAVYGTENNASGASGRGVYDVALNTGGEGHVMEGTAYDLTADIHGAVSGAVGSVTGNVTGSVGSIATGGIAAASFAAGAIDATAIAANAIGASELATDAVAEIADGVWDEAIAGHLTAGTTGAKLNLIGTASYTVTSPVSSDGTAITIVRGDDYLLTDSRQLAFTSTGWPTITGATVKLRVKFGKTATITEYTATVTGAQACYVPLTTVQTAAMVPGVYKFDLQATLSNLSIVTLVQGTLSVWEDVR